MTAYLFRLDDICPTMRWSRFEQLVSLFDRHTIKPLLAVVPDNRDDTLAVDSPRADFWPRMTELSRQGWRIAQHGYQHRYETSDSGLLGLRNRSEFAGVPYEQQLHKIRVGQAILHQYLGQSPVWWSAPAHSFDTTTCRVLKELNFKYISDGIALYPYEASNLTWIPHQTWSPVAKPFGLWTIGVHLNTMTNRQVSKLETFVDTHASACQNIDLTPRHQVVTAFFRPLWYLQFRLIQALAA